MAKDERARTELASLQRQITVKELVQNNPIVVVLGITALSLGIGVLGITMIMVVTSTAGSRTVLMLLAAGVLLLGLAMTLLSMSVFGPSGLLAKKRAMRLDNAELTGLSEQELHAIIDIHRERGNLAEADRVSQHLLELVERDPTEADK